MATSRSSHGVGTSPPIARAASGASIARAPWPIARKREQRHRPAEIAVIATARRLGQHVQPCGGERGVEERSERERVYLLGAWDDVAAVERHGRVSGGEQQCARRAPHVGPDDARARGRRGRCAKERPPRGARARIAAGGEAPLPSREPLRRMRRQRGEHGAIRVMRPDDRLRARRRAPRRRALAAQERAEHRALDRRGAAGGAHQHVAIGVAAMVHCLVTTFARGIEPLARDDERLVASTLHSKQRCAECAFANWNSGARDSIEGVAHRRWNRDPWARGIGIEREPRRRDAPAQHVALAMQRREDWRRRRRVVRSLARDHERRVDRGIERGGRLRPVVERDHARTGAQEPVARRRPRVRATSSRGGGARATRRRG